MREGGFDPDLDTDSDTDTGKESKERTANREFRRLVILDHEKRVVNAVRRQTKIGVGIGIGIGIERWISCSNFAASRQPCRDLRD